MQSTLSSDADSWRELAKDLLGALTTMELLARVSQKSTKCPAILLTVARDFQRVSLQWCNLTGEPIHAETDGVTIRLRTLPKATDVERDDGSTAPNASIDRAISRLGADMLSWTKDAETFQLVQHQRCKLFLSWSLEEGHAQCVNEYAYGLWDE
jgi:hypothetical protein